METTQTQEKELVKRIYGKIVLTLENAILNCEKLDSQTVSQVDGLNIDIETDLRILGCELIQTAGILLKLPQVSKIFAFNSFQHLPAPYCKSVTRKQQKCF
jgi:cyclin L